MRGATIAIYYSYTGMSSKYPAMNIKTTIVALQHTTKAHAWPVYIVQ